MTAVCKFCGSPMDLRNNATSRILGGGEFQTVPASKHYLECSSLDCRSRGPVGLTPDAACLAYLRRPVPATLRILPV